MTELSPAAQLFSPADVGRAMIAVPNHIPLEAAMISALVDRANKRTVTLTPLNADGLAAWRTTATPAARVWLAGHAFTAAPGTH